jgi:integrase/recombinase XerD
MILQDAIRAHLQHLQTLGRSPYTVKNTRSMLRSLVAFLEEQKIDTIEDLQLDVLEEYQQDLAFRVTAKGQMLSLRTQGLILGIVKSFTRYLKQKDYLLHDPGVRLKLPRKPKRLPKVILSAKDVKKLIEAPDTHTLRGYRNRILVEILYDTAIRRSELAGIKVNDLDLNAGFIRIQGKGDKDRVVPLSQRVSELVKNYLLGVRPSLVSENDDGYLLLNRWGRKMDPNAVWAVVKRCSHLASLRKNVSTHTLRHTCATHMLKNGAPIRYLQEMLGHESLESTQLYTHVTINDLKEIHRKYHPSEQIAEKQEQ